MPQTHSIAVLVGSLRKDAFTRKMAHALAAAAPPSLRLAIVEIRDLPHYDQDLDTDVAPVEWQRFREQVRAADGVLFVTPEYNRSVPGALKNAIDVGSRPYGHSVWAGKPAAVMSVTPGGLGAFGANHHLRQSLVFLDMPTMAQPEAYISGAGTVFGEDGQVTSEKSREFLARFTNAFARWVETHDQAR